MFAQLDSVILDGRKGVEGSVKSKVKRITRNVTHGLYILCTEKKNAQFDLKYIPNPVYKNALCVRVYKSCVQTPNKDDDATITHHNTPYMSAMMMKMTSLIFKGKEEDALMTLMPPI